MSVCGVTFHSLTFLFRVQLRGEEKNERRIRKSVFKIFNKTMSKTTFRNCSTAIIYDALHRRARLVSFEDHDQRSLTLFFSESSVARFMMKSYLKEFLK